ncbi:MAG: RHS repeat-associated core domain-containing protein, partial [Ktedonobacterales bacterium]
TYSYNPANILASSNINGGEPTTYSYDANGNLTESSAGLSLRYNTLNQTTSMTTPGGTETSFTYAGTDQTQRVSASTSDGALTFANGLLGVSHQTGTGADATLFFARDNRGNLVASSPEAGSYAYYLFDGTGSVIGLTDATGHLAATYAYDPYGAITASTGEAVNPYRFASGYLDASTGYTKFGARYDDTTLGRWTQQDPVGGSLGNPNSVCRYLYAGDDPVNRTDPSGQCSVLTALAATVVALGSFITVAALVAALPEVTFAAILSNPELVGAGITAFGSYTAEILCLFGL